MPALYFNNDPAPSAATATAARNLFRLAILHEVEKRFIVAQCRVFQLRGHRQRHVGMPLSAIASHMANDAVGDDVAEGRHALLARLEARDTERSPASDT